MKTKKVIALTWLINQAKELRKLELKLLFQTEKTEKLLTVIVESRYYQQSGASSLLDEARTLNSSYKGERNQIIAIERSNTVCTV